jgi:predicted Zn-dependent protease
VKYIIILYLFFFSFVFANNGELSLVIDSEINYFLKDITRPILISANLEPEKINFYLVNDERINAFVTNGQNIFVNLGTITAFETPDALLGVLAHEIGHIAGGHLAKFKTGLKDATNISFASILIGVGALLSGVPELAQFVLLGGISAGQQNALIFTRNQEEQADAMAIQYLHQNNLSADFLLKSMKQFYKEQLILPKEMEYFITHPLTKTRMQHIESKIKDESNLKKNNFIKDKQVEFYFIKAKILAYNKKKYDFLGGDYKIYGDAIANNSLKDIDYLLSKYPKNPYFYELKGDICLKQNKITDAIKNYNIADKILINDVLIKKSIANIVVRYKQKEYYNDAINKLKYLLLLDGNDYITLKLLAEVYYNNNEKEKSEEIIKRYNEIKKSNEKHK